jgi:hypothetical protein
VRRAGQEEVGAEPDAAVGEELQHVSDVQGVPTAHVVEIAEMFGDVVQGVVGELAGGSVRGFEVEELADGGSCGRPPGGVRPRRAARW